MFSGELRNLFFQVITSWQVIAVTVAIILYVALINYVSRARYRRRNPPPEVRTKKTKKVVEEVKVDDSELKMED